MNEADPQVPLLGFAAWSGTGKTTLLEKIIPLLRRRGLRLAIIKHAHHDFDIDHEGKDSYRLRKAGANQTLVASRRRWALITEQEEEKSEPELSSLLTRLDHQQLDLILVEGFKHEAFPRIELHRPSLGKPLLFPDDENIVALATEQSAEIICSLPRLDINEPDQIVDFILGYFRNALERKPT